MLLTVLKEKPVIAQIVPLVIIAQSMIPETARKKAVRDLTRKQNDGRKMMKHIDVRIEYDENEYFGTLVSKQIEEILNEWHCEDLFTVTKLPEQPKPEGAEGRGK